MCHGIVRRALNQQMWQGDHEAWGLYRSTVQSFPDSPSRAGIESAIGRRRVTRAATGAPNRRTNPGRASHGPVTHPRNPRIRAAPDRARHPVLPTDTSCRRRTGVMKRTSRHPGPAHHCGGSASICPIDPCNAPTGLPNRNQAAHPERLIVQPPARVGPSPGRRARSLSAQS